VLVCRSKQQAYPEVIAALAAKIGLADPTKLRLTQHNVHTHMPRVQPFKFSTTDKLYEMLRANTSFSDILYYEVLDIPLPDLEKLKTLNVVWANSRTEEVSTTRPPPQRQRAPGGDRPAGPAGGASSKDVSEVVDGVRSDGSVV
jgi:hypothetical protein